MATLYATMHNTRTHEEALVWRENGATAPLYIFGKRPWLGYWETRLDIFGWACEALGWTALETAYLDGFTGEVLTFDDLLDEEYERLEMMDNID